MEIDHYKFEYGEYGETKGLRFNLKGFDVLRFPNINKGLAFTIAERRLLKISGFLPPGIRTLKEQVEASLEIIDQKENDIERFIYIRSLYDRNVVLAHAVIASDITKFLPIIYTPTVGLACQQYSKSFRSPNGIHFYPGNIDYAKYILRNYTDQDIRIVVVTDNQGVLGIGDQGAGGIPICLGKLMLYTQGAGIAPWHCLPISLDVGTDNEDLLSDPQYLGWRHKRIKEEDYYTFIDKFVTAFKNHFPNVLCQWEDFSKQNAFTVRDKYTKKLISFNDDIQGTGSIALAGILSAMRKKKRKWQIRYIWSMVQAPVGLVSQNKYGPPL